MDEYTVSINSKNRNCYFGYSKWVYEKDDLMHLRKQNPKRKQAARSLERATKERLSSVALLTALAAFTAPNSFAQSSSDHSAIWRKGDIIHVDGVVGLDATRVGSPLRGTFSFPYRTLEFAVNDVLYNQAQAARYPVVFNVEDFTGSQGVQDVTDLSLPAYGVKLQSWSPSGITLRGDGATSRAPVLHVDREGPRLMPDLSSPMPATIIQGFRITNGSEGILLDVQSETPIATLRTEIRDCVITGNKFDELVTILGNPDRDYWGGIGIRIRSHGNAPTQYVIEANKIFEHGDFFHGDGGPASYGIRIDAIGNAQDSSLIRGNELHDQETGIGVYGNTTDTPWVRPRILSNFFSDHEQHVWSLFNAGPVLYNDTFFRVRDYCLGPNRVIVAHQATPIPVGADPRMERTAMIVRNCIFDYTPVAPIEPGGPPTIPPNWPVVTFCGGGTIDVAFTDYEGISPPVLPVGLNPADLRLGAGNFLSRTIPFVGTGVPANLHLQATALMVDTGDLASIAPGQTINLNGTYLPCDVRTDVDGDVRVIDQKRDGSPDPDRGGDEAYVAHQFGMRLMSDAGALGNVLIGSNVTLTLEGVPGEVYLLRTWGDCPTDPFEDMVYNNVFLAPFGNFLLPDCGSVILSVGVFDASGEQKFTFGMNGLAETQIYFQSIGLFLGSNPNPGSASNRLRLELNG